MGDTNLALLVLLSLLLVWGVSERTIPHLYSRIPLASCRASSIPMELTLNHQGTSAKTAWPCVAQHSPQPPDGTPMRQPGQSFSGANLQCKPCCLTGEPSPGLRQAVNITTTSHQESAAPDPSLFH